MPAAPPSYDQVVGAGGGGGGMYPQVPEKGGPPPANYYPPPPAAYPQQPPAATQVVTQVQYVQAPSFGYRPLNMTCPHCHKNVTTRLANSKVLEEEEMDLRLNRQVILSQTINLHLDKMTKNDFVCSTS